jgi:hypothetical protein
MTATTSFFAVGSSLAAAAARPAVAFHSYGLLPIAWLLLLCLDQFVFGWLRVITDRSLTTITFLLFRVYGSAFPFGLDLSTPTARSLHLGL